MVGSMNVQSLLPKLSIMMLTQLANIPEGFTQQASLYGKYLKGIPTAVTNPDADIGNANHTHTSDGDHVHAATVASHTHTGVSNAVTSNVAGIGSVPVTGFNHFHTISSDSQAEA